MSQSSFYTVIRQNEKLREIWEQAKEERGEKQRAEMIIDARVGVRKLLRGEKMILTTTFKDADGNVINSTDREVYYPPSASAVMGVLRHIDRESIPEESLITVRVEPPSINFVLPDGTDVENEKPQDYKQIDEEQGNGQLNP